MAGVRGREGIQRGCGSGGWVAQPVDTLAVRAAARAIAPARAFRVDEAGSTTHCLRRPQPLPAAPHVAVPVQKALRDGAPHLLGRQWAALAVGVVPIPPLRSRLSLGRTGNTRARAACAPAPIGHQTAGGGRASRLRQNRHQPSEAPGALRWPRERVLGDQTGGEHLNHLIQRIGALLHARVVD
eukprot:scaffold902_cov124-Isochrysis_galbana.AAC.2